MSSPKHPRHVNVISYTQNRQRNLCYFQEDAANTLLGYSSGMVISGNIYCEQEDRELPALAVIPAMEENPNAHKLSAVPKVGGARRLIVNRDNIPAGQFILEEEPVYEGDLDWFILREVED